MPDRQPTPSGYYGRPERTADLGGVRFDLLGADPVRPVARHGHDDAHCILVLEGLYVTGATGPSPLIGPGSLVCNPPGTEHRDRFEPNDGRFRGRFLAVTLPRARLAEAAETGPLAAEPFVLVGGPVVAAAATAAARLAAGLVDPGALEGAALELAAAFSPAPSPVAPPPWLARARACLADRCGEPIGLREVAAEIGVHPVYLARAFRRHFGCSPSSYLRDRRTERARALLAATAAPLAEVAYRSGFCDQSHLNRHFGRKFGRTPAAERRLGSLPKPIPGRGRRQERHQQPSRSRPEDQRPA